MASPLAAFDYKLLGPPATGIIDCGPYSHPDHGCHAEDTDASAAYLQAVLWWITGDHRYADNSIRIMNTYARQLKGYTGSNTPLQAAWSSETFPRAAEIIRYSGAGWKREDIQAFSTLLTQVILPHHSRWRAKDQRKLGTEHDRGHDGHCGVHRRSCAAGARRRHVAEARVNVLL